jgi:hypothetical protein
MSGPQRQQLADVATVTPTLSDKTVTIQAGKVKTSLYSAIYDLFKTGFDAVYATIASVNGKLSLTGGTMSGAIAMGTSKITGLGDPTADQDAATKIYVDSLSTGFQTEYNLENTATGTTSVTINDTSGVATFTQRLNSKSNAYYQIDNTEIEEGDYIECNLRYNGAGFPIIMHYQTIANRIRIHMGNPAVDGGSGTNTDADLIVTFRKI